MIQPLAIYVHWPFCLAKCPYCDFNSHVRERVDQDAWQKALVRELKYFAEKTSNHHVGSIFFGGGTPSLMPPQTVKAVIDYVKDHWVQSSDLEITLEANPTSAEQKKFKAFHDAGVNRVSIGVQSLNQDALKFLGREHSSDEAIRAIKWAKDIFPRYSFDLIYARPNQTVTMWQDELNSALELVGTHLSLYQLTIEQGTKFHTLYQRGDLVLPDDDTSIALYEATEKICAQKDLYRYEVSNYASTGHESKHNLTYWHYGEYIGVGPGAGGRVVLNGQRHATEMIKAPELWLEAVQKHGHGLKSSEPLTPQQQATEMVMVGLRLRDGIDLSRLSAVYPNRLNHAVMISYVNQGLLILEDYQLSVSPSGNLVLNQILKSLLT